MKSRTIELQDVRPTGVVTVLPQMPQTRGDCENGPRPCPHVRCRYNLSVDVQEDRDSRVGGVPGVRNIQVNHPDVSSDDWDEIDPPEGNCALDYADRGGMTLEEVGEVFGVTRERIRQIEEMAAVRMHPKYVADTPRKRTSKARSYGVAVMTRELRAERRVLADYAGSER